MSSFDVIAEQFKKSYGDGIGGKAASLPEMPRVPSGIFAFDLATGGGIPMAKITEVYGPEGSGKTNLCYSLIGQHQKLYPKQKCAFLDIEGTFNEDWASNFGLDYSELYYFRPSYAEQAVDMVEALLYADDCGLVVVDSLAAMVTIRESEQSAEKSDVGGEAQAVKKMVKKATKAFTDMEKKGNAPTLVMVNQTRSKIGVMYGNPETTPGGQAKNFFASMRIRIYGKDEMDPKVHKMLPATKKVSMVLQKWKCRIVAKSADWQMVMVPHKGLPTGYVNDWNLIKSYMEDYGMLGKTEDGKKWKMFDEEYPTLKACKEHLMQDQEFGNLVRTAIIEKAKEEAETGTINDDKKE